MQTDGVLVFVVVPAVQLSGSPQSGWLSPGWPTLLIAVPSQRSRSAVVDGWPGGPANATSTWITLGRVAGGHTRWPGTTGLLPNVRHNPNLLLADLRKERAPRLLPPAFRALGNQARPRLAQRLLLDAIALSRTRHGASAASAGIRPVGSVRPRMSKTYACRERRHTPGQDEFNGPGHRGRRESVRGAEEGDGDNRPCAYEEGGRNDERSVEPSCAGDESASCCAEWSDPVPEEPER